LIDKLLKKIYNRNRSQA